MHTTRTQQLQNIGRTREWTVAEYYIQKLLKTLPKKKTKLKVNKKKHERTS